MCGNLSPRLRFCGAFMLCALLTLTVASAFAQSPQAGTAPVAQASPTPEAKPSPSLEHEFFKNVLRDQRAIWTWPFRTGHGEVRWLVPLGLSTAALVATDRYTAGELGDDRTRLRISRDISLGGSLYTTAGISATFYLVGRAAKNERARETGLLAAEALIDSNIVHQALKAATQRPRPRVDNASGEFFEGGRSFPSGHATNAWSLATVVASEYGRHRPLVRVVAYGLATAVAVSRFTGRNHFLSDVLAGSAIGYGIGRYVYHTHHDKSLDEDDTK